MRAQSGAQRCAIEHDFQRKPVLKSVALLFNPERRQAVETTGQLASTLRDKGIDVFSNSAWDRPLRNRLLGRELAIVLGGDGTILGVARETAGTGIPTLGINLGHVGFLTELTPDLIEDALPRILDQDYWIETRHILEARWTQSGKAMQHLALNEVAVARGASTRAIRVGVWVDGFHYTTHTADGVLVSTATGSTAYSLAAGGPIMFPESSDILLTPVAPHLNIGRSLVLPGTVSVGLQLEHESAAMLAIDGQTECPLEVGSEVMVKRSDQKALFARLGTRTYFYSVLSERLA